MLTEDRTTLGQCRQCGSKEGPFTTREVIHRKFDHAIGKQYVGRTRYTVCDNGKCGGYLQMAHEG